jgi:hypothetical protein
MRKGMRAALQPSRGIGGVLVSCLVDCNWIDGRRESRERKSIAEISGREKKKQSTKGGILRIKGTTVPPEEQKKTAVLTSKIARPGDLYINV